MRIVSSIIILLASISCFATAQEFGAVQYLGQFTPPSGGGYTAGCWGWTDTTSGREYALLGNSCGTAIVEITNVGAMVERDFVPGVCSSWREIQTHENYAYVVSEGGGGTQIIDLSYLPDSVHLVGAFTYTSGPSSTIQSHSIHIMDGYMYLNGCADAFGGGIGIFDLANPESPVYRGQYSANYIHDCYVKNDTIFAAAIYGVGIVVIDASVKTAPDPLYTIGYAGAGTHNTSTTIDGAYILSTDEIGATAKTLKIWDRATSSMVAEYVGSPTAIVHNVFVRESLAIMSYYTAGIRVVDISNPAAPVEIGGYDTQPFDESTSYTGAWSVYPFFPSGKIIIGDMGDGMFVVEVNVDAPLPPAPFGAYSDYSSPNAVTLNWTDPTQKADGSPLSDFKLHIYRGNTYIAEVDSGVGTYVDGGRTNHWYYTYFIRAVTATDSSSVTSSAAWAGGHPQPKPPTAFQVSDGEATNILGWVNPSRQLDNTPLNDLAYVLIHRDGSPFDSIAQSSADTGAARSWIDSSGGYHTYYIQARDNETPRNYSTPTATGSGFGGLYSSFNETFDSALTTYQVTGAWDTTSAIAASESNSLTDSPGGNYPPSSTRSITFPRVILGPDPILRFNHIAIVAFGDIAFLEISSNNRQTWSTLKVYNLVGHAAWEDLSADPGDWEPQFFDLASREGDSVNVRFRLVTNPTNELDGWYLDDIYIGTSQEADTVERLTAGGWNLVSLPVLAVDASTATLYGAALTPAYGYANAYYPEDTVENGRGYWAKFNPGEEIDYPGLSVLRDTFDVEAGWNLIGSVSVPIAASTVASIPPSSIETPFYAYDGGYNVATDLEPGLGYWVKSSQNAKIILSGFLQSMPPAAIPSAVPSEEAAGNARGNATGSDHGTLTFTDAAGNQTDLEMRTSPAEGAEAGAYDLPPVPPAGAFDVRFATQKRMEVFAGGRSATTISAQDVTYPLTIAWRIPADAAASISLGGSARELAGGGSMTLDAEQSSMTLSYGASSSELRPTEFGLSENYPNPFNPSTTLEFLLPEAGVVTIEIFNTLGQRVATLAEGPLPAGVHRRVWDTSAQGDLPGGVYHAKMTVTGPAGEMLFSDSRKMLLIR